MIGIVKSAMTAHGQTSACGEPQAPPPANRAAAYPVFTSGAISTG
jgi:hypothetical protein